MKLGIKVGPRPESITDLEATNAPFAEVWFQINKKDDYTDLFSYLTKKHIDTGLHFWGLTRDGLLPTLTYDDQALLTESMDLIKQTIDTASNNNFSYVNIHPGYRTKVSGDFAKLIFSKKDDRIVPYEQATTHFLDCINQLTGYAESKNVLLTVETTPIRFPVGSFHDKTKRQTVKDISEYSYLDLPADTIQFALANDFGHTAANCIANDGQTVWKYLFKKTIEYAPKTQLLHLGYIIPPYNGSDYHDHLDNPMFPTGYAVPNKNQMIQLLKLFIKRTDVRALVEPDGRHQENYFLAQKLLVDAGI